MNIELFKDLQCDMHELSNTFDEDDDLLTCPHCGEETEEKERMPVDGDYINICPFCKAVWEDEE